MCGVLQVLSAGEHVINNKKVDPKKAKARHGKIFVGGLVPDLSDDDIKNFFGQYGTVSQPSVFAVVTNAFDKGLAEFFCLVNKMKTSKC